MKVVLFSTKPYDRASFLEANAPHGHDLTFLEAKLAPETSGLAAGFPAVCAFVNDHLDAPVLHALARQGTGLLALRSAGFNHVDLQAAHDVHLTVVRVPAYSPYSVAEHTVALILALNRKTHRAYARVRDGNFALEGLLGFDLHGRTVGVIGTGRIGAAVVRIMRGFGCRVLTMDVAENAECKADGAEYVAVQDLLRQADIVTLHCPLTPGTHHLINRDAVNLMKHGVMLINTSRGGLVDTPAVVEGLKSGAIGYLGLDVYEEEGDLFFQDLSAQVMQDDVFARLLTFPNVLITGHQAFFTAEALRNIAETTLQNISAFARGETAVNAVSLAGLSQRDR